MKPISRLGIGSLSLVQLVLAVVLFLAAAYLSANYYKVWDLTKDRDFTLSDLTQKILAKDPLSEREDPIRITVAFRKSSPFFERVRRTVDEFERESGGRIEARYLDPVREPDAAARFVSNYPGITLNTDLLLIDARTKGSSEPDPNLTRFLEVDDLIIYSTDQNNQRRPEGFQIEDRLATALLSIAEGAPRKLYFLADKSPVESGSSESPWAMLADTLLRQNLVLTPLNLSDIQSIPADAEGIVLVAPSYDLENREIDILNEYWARPGSAILAILDPRHRPTKLRAFLRSHGITPNDDRLISVQNGRSISQVPAIFTSFAGVNEGLAGQSTTFDGPTCSLTVRENAEDLNKRNIHPFNLLEASAKFWGETRYQEVGVLPEFNSGTDLRREQGLPVAAAVIMGDAKSDEAAEAAARMVVISNSHFLHPERAREEQIDFVKNSVNWLIGREELVGVGPRGLRTYKLNLIGPEVSFLNNLILLFLPAGLLVMGGLVWSNRRA
ncbi:DUF7088 domain-containing protein [Roseibacillus ishigakijimensis]|uniref:Gldg family protein n=1 Tax=Roseibacillus ishigakijimensis TaxID=454146 RepID=A0A934RUK0_9BACT|nr:Gldg family protein [Roseibacillus ishigakijimensis]MBK1834756.1 Gldg family protein [Roseibacillus ishigakijimensis]